MQSIIHSPTLSRSSRVRREVSEETFRKPLYDCQDQDGALKLVVFVPGVDASGVTIEARDSDLRITALKSHYVRVNWQSAHLEGAQRDYRLNLRLGRGYAYEAMDAEMSHGVLTITLPKRARLAAAA